MDDRSALTSKIPKHTGSFSGLQSLIMNHILRLPCGAIHPLEKYESSRPISSSFARLINSTPLVASLSLLSLRTLRKHVFPLSISRTFKLNARFSSKTFSTTIADKRSLLLPFRWVRFEEEHSRTRAIRNETRSFPSRVYFSRETFSIPVAF